jgi:CBS domain-containing protein
MHLFDQPVSSYMTATIIAVDRDTTLDEVAALLTGHDISAVPVCTADRSLVGVVSRTDLIRVGIVHRGATSSASLGIPAQSAESLMSPRSVVVSASNRLRDAAALMLAQHIHRVFVIDHQRLVGVLSATDLARAARDARLALPLSAIMNRSMISIEASAQLSVANAMLDKHQISGLIVTDDGWPIGMYTQTEVLFSRDLPFATPVGEVLDPSMVCLPLEMEVYRAAGTALELGVRRIIACKDREAAGIVSGMDFVKLVATA